MPEVNSDVAPVSQKAANDKHIVDVLIEERAQRLMRHRLLWPLLRSGLYPLLRYRQALEMADEYGALSGEDIFDRLGRKLNMALSVSGLEYVPATGSALVIANHPTGIADGIAVKEALRPRRTDVSFLANGDALRVAPGLIDTLIPVEWVEEKRTLAKTRDMLRLTRESIEKGRLVGIFPAGRLGRMTLSGLEDPEWFSSTISFMRRFDVPVVPLHIQARNSLSYYLFSLLHKELKDITLFNELLNKQGTQYKMTFGPMISFEDLEGAPQKAIEQLKFYVERDLPLGRDFKQNAKTRENNE